MSQEFQESLKDIDFANPPLASRFPAEQFKAVYMISDDSIEDIKAIYSNESLGAVLFSEDFIKLFCASDFHQFL